MLAYWLRRLGLAWNLGSAWEEFPEGPFKVRVGIRYLRHAQSAVRRSYYLCQKAYERARTASEQVDFLHELLEIADVLQILITAEASVIEEATAKMRDEMAVRDAL